MKNLGDPRLTNVLLFAIAIAVWILVFDGPNAI